MSPTALTVDGLLLRLRKAFPKFFDDGALETWGPVFHAALGRYEGPALANAFDAMMINFKPGIGHLFPLPVDFAPHLPPSLASSLRNGATPAIDWKRQRDKRRSLLHEWRQAQGLRLAQGCAELFNALAYSAAQIAYVAAFAELPAAVRLTRGEYRIAKHDALSQHRRFRHGYQPHLTEAQWWAQISAIAQERGIETSLHEWAANFAADDDELEA